MVAVLFAGLQPVSAQSDSQGFAIRGAHIDLRTQVMTMPALKQLALEASQDGLNTLIMEWEAAFPFEKHSTICKKGAYTKEEIREFVRYCASVGIDVIPLQNCFGHCDYILRHQRYNSLREDKKDPSQVCPLCPECHQVFTEIFTEVAALHPSKYIHIGADETRLLGKCRKCAAKVKEEGTSKLFVDYVNEMCGIVAALGKTPIIWSDMILKHPEAVAELPKDLIILDWNYGWDPNRFGKLSVIRDAGFEMWGAPSLRSSPDNVFLTMWAKHFQNLSDYIPFSKDFGYTGMIETSWSTSGVYGALYDDSYEVIEMFPMREVYPLNGFRIIQRAYAKAACSPCAPLDWRSFVKEYGEDHFGIAPSQLDAFLAYFEMPQKTVTGAQFKQDYIQRQHDLCVQMQKSFGGIKVKKHKGEFEHFTLMLDIRTNYLAFKLWECGYESEGAASKKELRNIYNDALSLQKRYIKLNKAYLKYPEDSFGDNSYLGKMRIILSNL